MKQVVANPMAVDHTRGVRFETGNMLTGLPCLYEIDDMGPMKNNCFKFSSKNYHNFSLHDHKTVDIKPIERIDVSAVFQRHCSTTFYQ